MREQLAPISKKTKLAEAIRYALSRWEGLTRFVDDGRLEIDSNVVDCEQGAVLYLALEDNQRRLQSRLRKIMPEGRGPKTLHFATNWQRAAAGGIAAIQKSIDEQDDPRLVIVDVLAMFRDPPKGRDQQYDVDYFAIKALQALALRNRVAVLIIHHTRKGASESGDPFERISGTLGLAGAADSALVLDKDAKGVTLYGRGRDIEEIETAVAFDKETCRWKALGAASAVRRTDERKKILDLLAETGEPLTAYEMADALGASRNSTKQLVFKMLRSGELEKAAKRGRYCLPDWSGPLGEVTGGETDNFDDNLSDNPEDEPGEA